eukprot:1917461-Pleurochrysis_carterae.AAC.1
MPTQRFGVTPTSCRMMVVSVEASSPPLRCVLEVRKRTSLVWICVKEAGHQRTVMHNASPKR